MLGIISKYFGDTGGFPLVLRTRNQGEEERGMEQPDQAGPTDSAAHPTEPRTAETAGKLAHLRTLSEYVQIKEKLKSAGLWSIFLGLLAMAQGSAIAGTDRTIGLTIGLIGLFLLVEGIWLRVAPTPIGLVLEGIALILLGIWNLLETVHGLITRRQMGVMGFIGAVQVFVGVQSIREFPGFRKVRRSTPPDVIREVENLINGIRKANAKSCDDIIEIQSTSFLAGSTKWKARLAGPCAICITGKKDKVLILAEDEVLLERTGKVLLGKTLRIEGRLGADAVKGTMSPEHFERFEAWKVQEAQASGADASEEP